ncbi:Na+/H+ antiporter NhaA [Nocardioides sp. zg-536]|uniref:Na(+)/H(+) antiporter NhaA n=1 Tax=Nocardioides faecalis TaxID=2803858 RepID=A0A938YC38_9ACTN|nr:Na+/H+ antiporter NhaA [Nocardioides faecalis]MBS4751991.1 Na+/H+ antiporter NhaA [Nocardioides faecalis]QVI60423.1 Na+/H+ antiporter NhaA [Nocardioides faecalis]
MDPDAADACSFAAPAETRTASPLRHFISTETTGAALLVAAALVALVWANSPASGAYEDLWHLRLAVQLAGGGIDLDLHHWVNDGLMVVFFFVIGLEVRREFAVGELTDRRRLRVPLVAGLGGMLVPAALYLLLNPTGEAAAGWGVVIGTDTAFLLGALALVGPRVSTQLRIFLLTLTVIDDIVAVSVIGVVYSDGLEPAALAVAAACLVLLVVLDRVGEWRASPYVVTVLVLWIATLESGVHAAIAGMVSGLLVPAADPDRRLVQRAAARVRRFQQSPLPQVQRQARRELNRAVSVNERLQEVLHGWTSFVVVPVFALANAGIDLRDGVLRDALGSPITWGVVLGLVLGKLLGIGLGALGAVRLGAGELPEGVGAGHTLAGAALSGIGFTVSLLIIGLAFDDQRMQDEAKVGVLLAAVLAAALGWLVFAVAARFFDQRDAALPTTLAEPVDPATDHVAGPPDAPLTLVEYFDYECPFCARATGAAREVRRHFGDRLRYVARHLPLAVHPHAVLAGVAAEAAGRQGRFWEMHDLLFSNQDRLSRADLLEHAATLGLDVDRFAADLDDPALLARVERDETSAAGGGVRGTPTFFVGTERHQGPYDARSLIAALEAAAQRTRS